MKHAPLLPVILLCMTGLARSQPVYISKSGDISFYSSAPVEDIEAHNASPNSILNTATSEIAFMVPVSNFKFRKALMQEHFNEKFMESDKYPNATFSGKINEAVNLAIPGEYDVSVTGKLNIHGVEQTVTESGKLTVAEKKIMLKSEMRIAIADYHIVIPKLLFDNIADTIQVTIRANYEPYSKKN